MSFPSDVNLPPNAKYYGFIDTKISHNTHWDMTWSFSFALTGSNHAFCTFLTPHSTAGVIPGQYLGYLASGEVIYLTDELGNTLTDELSNLLVMDNGEPGMLSIAFDTTGLFALSSSLSAYNFGGIPLSQVKPNSLIVRDYNNTVIYNEQLSSLDTSFFLTSAVKNYQTLRFRISNAGRKLHIDKQLSDYTYNNLLTLAISSFDADTYDNVYAGFTFCSPVSGTTQPISTLYLKNFHVQSNSSPPTYENIDYTSIYTSTLTTFTTVSGVL